jgi:hypothetical protein
MNATRWFLLFSFLAFLTSQTAFAELASNGANVTVTATYQIPTSGIFENDSDIVNGGDVTGQAIAGGNVGTGRAGTSGVWVSGIAAGLDTSQPGNISTAGGTATSNVINVTGGTLIIEGVYAVVGDAWVTAPNTQSSGSGSFSFSMPNNDRWRIEAFASANASTSTNSSAVVRFTTRAPGEPTPPLPGSTPDQPFGDQILIASGADLSQQHSAGDGENDQFIRPVQVAGINLVPIVDGFGRTSPVYIGGDASSPPAPLQALSTESSLATMTAVEPYIIEDLQYLTFSNRVTHFTLPYAIGGDSEFLIRVAGQEYPYQVGDLFDFTAVDPTGVASFFLRGVDPGAINSDTEFDAIVSGLQFANNGATQVYTIGGQMVVPEPASMFLVAMASLYLLTTRKR